MTLQSEEHVCDEYKKTSSKHLHSHTSYSTQQEFCLYSKKIQVQLPIPITATPEFKSDIGKDILLYKQLHLESSVILTYLFCVYSGCTMAIAF